MKNKSAVLIMVMALGLGFCGCKKSAETAAKSAAESAGKSAESGEAVMLQAKWPVGNRYVQRMELAQNSETRMPQSPKPVRQDVTMGQDYAITVLKERAGGGRELELEFLEVDMDVSADGRSMMGFDSKGESIDDAGNPLAGAFRKIVGSRLKLLLDASNSVEQVEGMKEFTQNVTGKSPPQIKAMLGSMFTEDYFKQIVGYRQGLPGKPVKPGDTWPIKFDLGMGAMGTLGLDLQYTFKNWEDHDQRKCVVLEFTGSMRSKGGAGDGPMGTKLTIDQGTMSGQTWFDPDLGSAVDSAIDQKMIVLISFPQSPGGQPNQAFPTGNLTNRLNQKIAIKLVEFAQAKK